MEPVAGVLVGFTLVNPVGEKGEAKDGQHNGETHGDPAAWAAHASSSCDHFSAPCLAASACNASMASIKVFPHASSLPTP